MISAKRFLFSKSIFQKCRTNKMTILYCCVFYLETKQLLYTLSNIFIKNKGIIKIICASILRQINLKGRILLLRIFFLTYLLVYYLSVGLYNFYSRPKFCKVYLYYFVAPLILFLCFVLSYFSLCKCFSVQVLYIAMFSPCKFKTKTYFFARCLT